MAEKIKLVYLVPGRLSVRWERIFSLDTISQEFDLEYWDCEWDGIYPFTAVEPLDRPYLRVISSLDDFKFRLSHLPKDVLLVSDFDFEERNYRLYKLISRHVKNIIRIDVWTYSILSLLNTSYTVLPDRKKYEPFYCIIKKILYNQFVIRAFFKKVRHGKEYNIIEDYYSFRELQKDNRWVRYHNKCVDLFNYYLLSTTPGSKFYINHPDYEKFLNIRNSKSIVNNKYIVYIDQYFPFHPDFKRNNPTLDVSDIANSFYKSINRFFDIIEKQHKCKVVIAAHPIAQYITHNPFNNREVIYYKTAELIQHASAVCMHYSNSFSFVALYDKPFALLDCRAIQQCKSVEHSNRQFAAGLRMNLTDIDNIFDGSEIFSKGDKEIRNRYIRGLADISETHSNDYLYKENFMKIHEEIVNNLYD